MSQYLDLRQIVPCGGIAILGLLPALVAMDFGGFLPWTQFVMALTVLSVAGVCLITDITFPSAATENSLHWKSFLLPILLVLLLGFALLQTVPIPQSLLAILSPASHQAHVLWAGEIVGPSAHERFPVSLSVFDSRNAICLIAILLLIAYVMPIVCSTPTRVRLMLTMLAFGGASVAIFGLVRMLAPSVPIWSFLDQPEGTPFGTFVNRNHASLAIQLGMTAAIGLAVTQLAANGFGQSQRDLGLRFRLLVANIRNNRALLFAFWVITVGIAGVILSGSRGGMLTLIAALGGVLMSRFRQPQTRIRIGVVAIAVAGVTLIAMSHVRFASGHASADQTVDPSEMAGMQGITGWIRMIGNDYRLGHWPDALDTGLRHLPCGSGLGTYAFAYLPWQDTSPWRWFHHADNLWLEVFVELGVVGLLVTIGFFVALLWSLKRLGTSSQPLDAGIQAMGWYLVILLLVSQCFDFGLIAPTNLLAATLLASIVFARAGCLAASRSNTSISAANWMSAAIVGRRSTQQTRVIGVVGAMLLLAGVYATEGLRTSARSDGIFRHSTIHFTRHRSDRDALEQQLANMERFADKHASPNVMNQIVKYRIRLGRLSQKRVHSGSQTARNHGSVNESQAKPVASDDYQQALIWSERSLRQRPLSLQPRLAQVSLEIVHQSERRTVDSILQSAKLFRNNPDIQHRLGTLLADHTNSTGDSESPFRAHPISRRGASQFHENRSDHASD